MCMRGVNGVLFSQTVLLFDEMDTTYWTKKRETETSISLVALESIWDGSCRGIDIIDIWIYLLTPILKHCASL